MLVCQKKKSRPFNGYLCCRDYETETMTGLNAFAKIKSPISLENTGLFKIADWGLVPTSFLSRNDFQPTKVDIAGLSR